MTYEHLRVEIDDQIATITLDRPEKLNALSRDLHNEMVAAATALQADDDVRVLIVTGAGRGFCSGADLTARPSANGVSESQNARLDEYGWVGAQALAFGQIDKPTIAAVNGVAAGAGMSLALACDIRVGSEKARFKTVFLERSLSPDAGMTWFLPRIVGYAKAAELVLTSRFVESDEALEMGLLNTRVGSRRADCGGARDCRTDRVVAAARRPVGEARHAAQPQRHARRGPAQRDHRDSLTPPDRRTMSPRRKRRSLSVVSRTSLASERDSDPRGGAAGRSRDPALDSWSGGVRGRAGGDGQNDRGRHPRARLRAGPPL